MSRIAESFRACRERGEGALVCYVMGGDPDVEMSGRVLEALAEGGADVIEFGVPFSDPMADGRVIEQAAWRALAAGARLADIYATVRRFREKHATPLLLMSYWNPILQHGIEQSCADAVAAGVDGYLVTDLPPEEASDWIAAARRHGLDTIFLLAPTSPEARVELVGRESRGFVYCVSRLGVTGERAELPTDLFALIARIKEHTASPVAVGFGISTPEHVAQVCAYADGVVVGSALVKAVSEGGKDAPARVRALVREMKAATRKSG